MKSATILATLFALVQGTVGIRTLQNPEKIYEKKQNKFRMLMQTKPAPAPVPAPPVPYKGKGSGKGSMMGKGMGMMPMMYKGKGKGKGSMMSGKGSMMGKGSMDYKGKGKGSMMSGKGSMMSGKGSMEYKGKGGDAKGKGGGKGSMMSGKGSMDSKGKGYDAKGKGKGYDAKGKGKGEYMPTIGDIIYESKDLSTLAFALETADLLDFFYDPYFEYTVFAPYNPAFEAFAHAYPDLYAILFDEYWILHLVDLLTMHVTEPAVYAADIMDGMEIETFNLEVITASTSDGVCFSPSVTGSSCVEIADIGAKNGVVHVVDDVIKPFWLDYTVMDIIAGIPDLDILESLVVCSGLDEQLSGYIGMTVFAPTNDAFADADVDYLCSEEGLKTLIDVLTYHVIIFPLPSVLLEVGEWTAETVQGSDVTITYYPDEKMPENTVVMYDEANIIEVDYGAMNGIVHIIDAVVFPPVPSKGKGKGAPAKGKGAPAKGKGAPAKGSGKGSSMGMSGKGSSMSKGKGM